MLSNCNYTTLNSKEACANHGICLDQNGRNHTFVCLCTDSWNYLDDCRSQVWDVLGIPLYAATVCVRHFHLIFPFCPIRDVIGVKVKGRPCDLLNAAAMRVPHL